MVVTGYTLMSDNVGGAVEFGLWILRCDWVKEDHVVELFLGMSDAFGIPTLHPGPDCEIRPLTRRPGMQLTRVSYDVGDGRS